METTCEWTITGFEGSNTPGGSAQRAAAKREFHPGHHPSDGLQSSADRPARPNPEVQLARRAVMLANLSPMERGRALGQWMEHLGLKRTPETAATLGLTDHDFERLLSLAESPPDVRQSLERGVIRASQAQKYAQIGDPDLRARLLEAAEAAFIQKRLRQASQSKWSTAQPEQDDVELPPADEIDHRERVRRLPQVLEMDPQTAATFEAVLYDHALKGSAATLFAALLTHGSSLPCALAAVKSLEPTVVEALGNLLERAFQQRLASTPAASEALKKVIEICLQSLEQPAVGNGG